MTDGCTCPVGEWYTELCDYCQKEHEETLERLAQDEAEARKADDAALQNLTNFIVRGNGW